MRREERRIKDEEQLYEILGKGDVVILGIDDSPAPYVVPLFFGFENRTLAIHSALTGRKLDLIKKNPHVSFLVVAGYEITREKSPCRWSSHYTSVMGTGLAELVSDPALKQKGLDALMKKYEKGPFHYNPESLEKIVLIQVSIKTLTGKKA